MEEGKGRGFGRGGDVRDEGGKGRGRMKVRGGECEGRCGRVDIGGVETGTWGWEGSERRGNSRRCVRSWKKV